MRPALLASFVLSLYVLLLAGCARDSEPQFTRLTGATMGTSYHITLVADLPEARVAELQTGVSQLLDTINESMSTYIEDSEINRLSRSTLGEWVPVSNDLLQVLVLSREVSDLSAGAFDITVRPLIDLWGFGPAQSEDRVPDAEVINRLLSTHMGYQQLEIDMTGQRVRRNADITLDLSAVAKGYAVDRVAQFLVDSGYSDLLVEIGGELALRGSKAPGVPWRIAVERPQPGVTGMVQRALSLSDCGLATSGDYRNYFERDGVRYSHTLDPRTGYPVQHNLASVTVIAETAGRADALATGFSVMGMEAALQVANREEIAVLFIIRRDGEFVEVTSQAFQPYL